MTDLRALCGTLLTGCPAPDELQTAEDFLRSTLAEAARDGGSRQAFLVPWEPASPSFPEDPATRRALLGALAPALLLDGVWLAAAAQPATAHLRSESLLFELYCRTMGLDDPARSPPLRFRAALTTAGVYLPPLDHPGFFQEPQIPECALRLPCLHLSLRHRPRTFFPELLGYILAHSYRKRAWWDTPPADEPPFETEAGHLALAALESYPGKDAEAGRILAGWTLYRFAFDSLLRDLGEHFTRKYTAEDAMAAIVRAKRPYAMGYHQKVFVAGRSLDQWLAEGEADFRPLLQALANSPEVDRACPAASRLIRAMDFGGAMFGVFDEKERRVCLDWIEDAEASASPLSLAGGGSGCGSEDRATPSRTMSSNLPIQEPDVGANLFASHGQSSANEFAPTAAGPRPSGTWTPLGAGRTLRSLPSRPSPGKREGTRPRRLFTALLRAESPADCPPAAEAFIQGILRRTRRLRPLQGADRRGLIYSPEVFRRHIDTLHRRELDRYRPLSGRPRIGREFCRWAALQLAPAILVDGAWLAGVATASEKLGDIGRHLLKIYADELGNGHPERNHPNVYRRLLESLDFDLPPVDSESFAQNPAFLDTAFDIPIYLLAMGLLTHKYFPELLGLNLAIELSGLGAGYLRAIDILRYHGIDPTIIRLHLSIDNLASGHAAKGREAIVLYLDGIGRHQGAEAVQGQWERIWTGYLSLNVAALGLAARFILGYFRQRLHPRRRLGPGP